ncbi:MAG: AbrB family transcriptional regulator [Clostridia bacterium]|nr:AbrB family transcriptional regulator [Clostridia bacterium]
MKKIGVVKEIDKLGRIVIPKEFRERYNLGDNVEIIACEEGVLLRNSEYILVKRNTVEEKNNKK